MLNAEKFGTQLKVVGQVWEYVLMVIKSCCGWVYLVRSIGVLVWGSIRTRCYSIKRCV